MDEQDSVPSPVVDNGDDPIVNGTRRSARVKKATQKYEEEHSVPQEKPNQATPPPQRPKRRAAEAAREQIHPEDVSLLHEQLFARMDDDERKEYEGWVELESEPVFFNTMLQNLGAEKLKVQEIFALDSQELAALPQPVYGLIFLYEYTNEDESNESRQECPDGLWFGNQTTTNACATVALINIIMNVHSVKFGTELEEFRVKTKHLPPPHRGYALDTCGFIRAIHNSVARRTELLNEDLLLDNNAESAAAIKGRKAPSKKRKKNSRSGRLAPEPDSFHYIAFVPVDGQVWELDGLETMPLCLGPCEGDDWLAVASEAIQNRMGRQNDDFLRYNLLAICQSPLLTLSQQLAKSIAEANVLDDLYADSGSWDVPSLWARFPDHRLARFDLTRERIIEDSYLPIMIDTRLRDPSFDVAAAKDMALKLRDEQEDLERRYLIEQATIAEGVEKFRMRGEDYTPAIHQWVRILAEKGELRKLIQDIDELS
ncbi:ubiquitin carboxyl-terminal hydrolase [Xylaria arbuscula]|nr:ubiquitin carboxyl-terminal hydrolase [Xylaria arbuscula]